MTPESVRRETLQLASGVWVGPWQVLLRVGELDPALLGTEIVALVSAALADLADSGCLRFVRGDPTLGEGIAPTELARSEAMAAIRDTGWRAATPAGDIWFTLTPKGERAVDRASGGRVPRRRGRELAKVLAGFAAAVRGMTRRRNERRGVGSTELLRPRSDRDIQWGDDYLPIGPSEPFDRGLDGDFDDDAGLTASFVPRRPPDRSGSGAAAAVPEPEYHFEIEAQRIA
jgi:hypothetical protein